MRHRLRSAMMPEQLAEVYAEPHSDVSWRGHRIRVQTTIALALTALDVDDRQSVADLSCGDARIARAMRSGRQRPILGDLAPGYECVGPIEETLPTMQLVDTFVCTETIEHLDNPEMVLAMIRGKAGHLVLSTPLECWDDPNAEHYWAWDRDAVELMLLQCNWTVRAFVHLDVRPLPELYAYGVWICS